MESDPRQDELILDRYEPLGTAGAGGFGTVQIAWDPRIQRKVAIKTIKLTALDAARAALPGAQAVSPASTADRWRGVVPWDEYLAADDAARAALAGEGDEQQNAPVTRFREEDPACEDVAGDEAPMRPVAYQHAVEPRDQITSLAHLPGLDEARTAAMLDDERIVTVYDFEVRGRIAYLIMEYVEGVTLTRLLGDYPEYLTLDMVAAVFDSVAGALGVAHNAGVLHLDIKPDNILINGQGKVKVTDFGLATLADASGAGRTGGGTIGYMPLEQMRREHLDARSDEWSLASVTYEMLTGDNPFKVQGLDAAEAAIEDAELILPSLCWENLDDQADDVLFYALDPDREERYASVADFAEEMDKFLGNPEQGREQLALVVEDALGFEEEDDYVDEYEEEYGDWDAEDHRVDARVPVVGRALTLFSSAARGVENVAGSLGIGASKGESNSRGQGRLEADYDDGYEDDAYYDPEDEGRQSGRSRGRSRARGGEHVPLAQRLPERVHAFAPRAFAAVACGFMSCLALSNMQILASGFGPGTRYVIGFLTAVVAVLAAFVPHVGAFVACILLGVAIILCGHPVVGAVTLVATVVWWYTVGHEGKAAANSAMLMPLLGAIGGSSAVPFVVGVSLPPVRAIATMAFSAVLAYALGSLGTCSLLGWDAFANWNFMRSDIAANALSMVTQPSTWATIAGWIAAAAALSYLRTLTSRWAFVAGVALALVAVLVGSLVFASPTPQLIVPCVLAAAALIAALV